MKKILFPIFLLILFSANVHGNPGKDLVTAARDQIGKTILYDPSYKVLGYPNGDAAMDRGVCTDVIIRALRSALDLDLQKSVHEDMALHFSEYPQQWGLTSPDKNIDHRRVPNLRTFFRRKGWSLDISGTAAEYRAGDIVTCIVPPHLPHIMMVSDKKNGHGVPLVIHNIGAGAQEENRLFEFELTGHYRITGIVQATGP
ncbi:MAG: DUF1287 domain-containing protein [Desulfobacteraceae bacterium]|nr:DUF1287 domain-containing protein [Desulfobacteraceae bacterium]